MTNMLSAVSILCVVILLLIVILKRLGQPYLVAYMLAGCVLGPQMAGLFSSSSDIASLGELGILLLMFFLGMEIDIPDKHSLLRGPILSQSVKMGLSFMCALLMGTYLQWKMGNVLILSVLLIFNSTAVVSEYLRRTGDLRTETGRIVLNILLLQDILIAPAFTIFQLIGRKSVEWGTLAASGTGCLGLVLLLRAVRQRKVLAWSGWTELEKDHDLQVFVGALCCLGCAWLAVAAGLSAPIGSFAAGIALGRIKGFHWLGEVLKPFKVFFVALFFVSIGLMVDLSYVGNHWILLLSITLGILFINSCLSAIVFRLQGHSWRRSLYAGAMLSQTGELGMLACAVAYKAGIIGDSFYKLCVAVTGLALLLSTVWISLLRRILLDRVATNAQIPSPEQSF